MEQARLTAYYASLVHSTGRLRIQDFGIFPWENEADYAPRFGPVDPEAFARMSALEFPSDN